MYRRRNPWRWPLIILLLVLIGILSFSVWQLFTDPERGPLVTTCPGPDQYGYQCTDEEVLGYIDASQNIELFADDGGRQVELPFSFTFYGQSYETVWVSSNGNLQFNTSEPTFANECLTPEPIAELGDMIAVYWDDLDLTSQGAVEIEVVGQAPERVFVIEWQDVPRFGAPDDTLTFEVQLFEENDDIALLYNNVRLNGETNGSSATIGLQSQRLGAALQYSCDQFIVSDGQVIHFEHPEEPTEGEETNEIAPAHFVPEPKGEVATLLNRLNSEGERALPALRQRWLNQPRPRATAWQMVDLTADGQEELVLIWSSPYEGLNLSQLVILTYEQGRWQLAFEQYPFARQESASHLQFDRAQDKTGDEMVDLILRDPVEARYYLLSWQDGRWSLQATP